MSLLLHVPIHPVEHRLLQEVRTLGRGGFGVVVAAVNRLDGRQYAVKRIRLDAACPSAFTRLLREVLMDNGVYVSRNSICALRRI